MIFIWDNGGACSDHEIQFIDSDGVEPADAETFICAQSAFAGRYKPFVIAKAEELIPGEKLETVRLGSWADECDFFEVIFDYNPAPFTLDKVILGSLTTDVWKPSGLWDQTARSVLDYLAKAWDGRRRWLAAGREPQHMERVLAAWFAEYERRTAFRPYVLGGG